jgi:hypothetical protein
MRKIGNVLWFAIFANICFCSACTGGLERQFPCRDYAKQFFKLSTNERVNEFNKLDIEKQYCVFIYGNQVIHPPAIYLATEMAKQPSALPFLTKKLNETKDDLTIRDIVYAISELQRMKLYAVAHDKNLMKLLNAKVNQMKNDDWRKLTTDNLNDLSKAGK